MQVGVDDAGGAEAEAYRRRVDVDFKNAFNAMSQAALWAVMEELNIPDVDLLKALYANATVRLKPGEANPMMTVMEQQ